MTRFAIISDTHDQVANLKAVVKYCNKTEVTTLAHCGDLISPFMLKQLAQFNGSVHLIYGNNVGDQHLISSRCEAEYTNITHHGIFATFSLCGYKIALLHYPNQARGLASQSIYDIVCCGHSHYYNVELLDKTLLINPGHLLGEDDQAGFYIVDLNAWKIERIGVGISMFDHDIPIRKSTPVSLIEQ